MLMVTSERVRVELIGVIGLAVVCVVSAGATVCAAELNSLPVPAITIYPGDAIKDAWLIDREFALTSPVRGNVVLRRDAIVGKIARRTLLPGAPIPSNAVSEPKVVANGAKVRIVFEEGALTMSTYGAALQDGAVGELISLRNLETGLTISGVVQADGSVRMSGG